PPGPAAGRSAVPRRHAAGAGDDAGGAMTLRPVADRVAAGERGSVSILMIAAAGMAVVLCLGLGRVGGAAVLQARADTAADSAALAAADALALGRGPSGAAAAA